MGDLEESTPKLDEVDLEAICDFGSFDRPTTLAQYAVRVLVEFLAAEWDAVTILPSSTRSITAVSIDRDLRQILESHHPPAVEPDLEARLRAMRERFVASHSP